MNKNKQIPTCNLCGKHFKTNQGLGSHRVLYHRSDTNSDREQNLALSRDNEYVETLVNRVTSLEAEIKSLHSEMTSRNSLPLGLWELAVCLKCGLVLELDKAFRKRNWLEGDHFDCPKCGSVKEVIELISREEINAKTYAEIPEYEDKETGS